MRWIVHRLEMPSLLVGRVCTVRSRRWNNAQSCAVIPFCENRRFSSETFVAWAWRTAVLVQRQLLSGAGLHSAARLFARILSLPIWPHVSCSHGFRRQRSFLHSACRGTWPDVFSGQIERDGAQTLGQFAFACSYSPTAPDDGPFHREVVLPILGREDQPLKPQLRRLIFESCAVVAAGAQRKHAQRDGNAPWKMSQGSGQRSTRYKPGASHHFAWSAPSCRPIFWMTRLRTWQRPAFFAASHGLRAQLAINKGRRGGEGAVGYSSRPALRPPIPANPSPARAGLRSGWNLLLFSPFAARRLDLC